jgi:sugar lactone lactonase YvrE
MNEIGANPNDWDAHFQLMADIDLGEYNGTSYNIIGRDILAGCTFLALDKAGGKIYWTYGKTIARAKLDGTAAEALVTRGTSHTYGIALDVVNEKMYWTDYGTNKILRADLDGTAVEELVTTGLGDPLGLALDLNAGKLYWADCATDKVQRANLDGTAVEDLVTEGLDWPCGITLDLSAGRMYWTDYGTNKILRANLDGTSVEELVTTGLISPSGIALDVASGKMYWTDWGTRKIQRANLDGTVVEDIITTDLAHPSGIALDLDAGKMYWTDGGFVKIQRANLDGTGIEELLTQTSYRFKGVFDGNGHTISNFTYDSNGVDYVGIFGFTMLAEIKDLGLLEPNVESGDGYYVGALVGFNWGTTINFCYSEGGRISGTSSVGGLVGESGSVSNCYSSGSVVGIDIVGGLVGRNCGRISNCYSAGSVSGQSRVGGLVGENDTSPRTPILNCYSISSISGTNNVGGFVGDNVNGGAVGCFWDVNTSGEPNSDCGTGKTTAEMQTKNTFTDAGWDFVGEAANGTDDIWRLCEDDVNYPKLSWQFALGDFNCPDGVDVNDLVVLCEQWLLEELSADVWPDGGDGVVDFSDWASFADGWKSTNDIDGLADFAYQWLKTGANYYIADIAPARQGDGIVNMPDFAALAKNWLEGI